MRCRFRASGCRDETGTVTAEFAVVLPAVALVLGCALGAMATGGEQLRLQGAAFDAARLLGRGDSGALDPVRAVSPDARLAVRESGSLICADVTAAVTFGLLTGIELTASACALHDQ